MAIVAAPAPLFRLLRSLPGEPGVIPAEAAAPSAEITWSVLDLPVLFGTDFQSISAAIPYLRAEPHASAG
jgi:hypothetical protein